MFTQEQKDRLVETLTGQYLSLKRPEVRERFLWYWRQIDQATAVKVEAAVLTGAGQLAV